MMKNRQRFAILFAASLIAPACDGGIDGLRELVNSNIMYVPSSAMEPTLPTNSRLTAIRIDPGDLQRGDLYIVQRDVTDARVLRLVAMPGETVAMEDGALVINGEKLRLDPEGEHNFETQFDGPKTAARLREFFPGDRRGHSVLDMGESPLDNTRPVTLGPDQYFLLGDNRDNSADSRMEPDDFGTGGIGVVTSDQITHRVDMDSITP